MQPRTDLPERTELPAAYEAVRALISTLLGNEYDGATRDLLHTIEQGRHEDLLQEESVTLFLVDMGEALVGVLQGMAALMHVTPENQEEARYLADRYLMDVYRLVSTSKAIVAATDRLGYIAVRMPQLRRMKNSLHSSVAHEKEPVQLQRLNSNLNHIERQMAGVSRLKTDIAKWKARRKLILYALENPKSGLFVGYQSTKVPRSAAYRRVRRTNAHLLGNTTEDTPHVVPTSPGPALGSVSKVVQDTALPDAESDQTARHALLEALNNILLSLEITGALEQSRIR